MTFKRYAISFFLLFVLFWSIGFSNSYYYLNPYYISMDFIPNQLMLLLSSYQFILTLCFFIYFYVVKKSVLISLFKKPMNVDKSQEEAGYLSVFMFASVFLSAQFWISEASSFSSYILYASIVIVGLVSKVYLHFISFFISNYNKLSLFGGKKSGVIKKSIIFLVVLVNMAMVISVSINLGLNTSYHIARIGDKSISITPKRCNYYSFSTPFVTNTYCYSDDIVKNVVEQGNVPLLEKYIANNTRAENALGYDDTIIVFNDALLTFYDHASDENWIDSKGKMTPYASQKSNYTQYKDENINLIKDLKALVDNKKEGELVTLIINYKPTDNDFKNTLMSALKSEYALLKKPIEPLSIPS